MNLRQKILRRDPVFGSWVQSGSPAIADIIAGEGFDFVAADMEHGDITEAGLGEFVRAVRHQTAPLARVAANDTLAIRRALDLGAQGVIVPLVSSAAAAQAAVLSARYPPDGIRGFAFCQANGWGRDFDACARRANDETCVIVMIETREAVDALDEILAVDGVDGVLLGPYDLSGSYGVPGQLDDPQVTAAIRRVGETCQRHKKAAGQHIVTSDPDRIAAAIADGYTLIALGMDTQFVMDGARNALQAASAIVQQRHQSQPIITLSPIAEADLPAIAAWNEGRDAQFLMQWAGPGNEWPVTVASLASRFAQMDPETGRWYRIEADGRMIGTIELMRIDREARMATVGRFLLDPAEVNRGFGHAALDTLCRLAFSDLGLASLRLSVYDYNARAIRCYQRTGFVQDSVRTLPDGTQSISMIRRMDA